MQKFKTVDDLIIQLKPERPVYCIRKKSIHIASKTFQNKFPGKILYAVKTNPNPEVLRTVVDSGIKDFDVASIKEIEENINRAMQGVKTTEEFYDKISSAHRIPMIKTPTFFLNSLDDPILGPKSIAYEAFENNENVILGITKPLFVTDKGLAQTDLVKKTLSILYIFVTIDDRCV